MPSDLKPSTKCWILVVDEDAAVRAALLIGLEDWGWRVRVTADLPGMMYQLEQEQFGLVLLSRQFLGNEKKDLPRQLDLWPDLPVICYGEPVGSAGEEIAVVRHGSGNGGEADIVSVRDRLTEVIRRYRKSVVDFDTVVFDQIAFDLRRRVVETEQGNIVELTETELKILELLLRHPGHVFSRDAIYQNLYGRERSPLDRTVDGHVARLRRKIKQTGTRPHLIRSVRGIGYVFSAPVRNSRGLTP